MKEDSVLNRLARNRTILANERTFLAYIRTSIMIGVSGVTFIKLLGDQLHFLIFGMVQLPIAVVIAVFGFMRYRTMNKRIVKTEIPDFSGEGEKVNRTT